MLWGAILCLIYILVIVCTFKHVLKDKYKYMVVVSIFFLGCAFLYMKIALETLKLDPVDKYNERKMATPLIMGAFAGLFMAYYTYAIL